MPPGQAVPQSAPAGVDQDGTSRRHENRSMVIKGGKLCFAQTLVDCMILNVSPGGALVRTDVVVPVPDSVILRFNAGGSFVASRQWARGTEIGLSFQQAAPMTNQNAASVLRSALAALPPDDGSGAYQQLRAERFFDDPLLAKAVEDAEAAAERLRKMLKERIGLPG